MESPGAFGVADQASGAGCSAVAADAAIEPPIFLLHQASAEPAFESVALASLAPPTEPATVLIPSNYESRWLDLTLGFALLVLLAPLMLFCALAVRCSGSGPIFFRQNRIGRGGEPFGCLKFRTMGVDAEQVIAKILSGSTDQASEWQAVQKLKVDPRVTRIGAFLRRYCLDELPQLFNVLAGQMSIVGPRPIVSAEIERYGADFPSYCLVRPGLTGLWQVSGRHALTYAERVQLDATYAQSRSLALDLQILWRTAPVVLFGQNS